MTSIDTEPATSAPTAPVHPPPDPNRVRFQGRLSAHRRLRLGRHRLVLSARGSNGKLSKSKAVKFRIVRR